VDPQPAGVGASPAPGGPDPAPDATPDAAPAAPDATPAPGDGRTTAATGAAAAPGVPCARNVTRGTVLARSLEVAESFGGRFMGLMGRAAIAPATGLWLRPGSSIHMLFMRFPIDAVFLAKPGEGGGRRVVAVHPSLRPWIGVVWWARGADGCLELPAGTAAASGTNVGDVVRLDEVDADRG
jgi:uncharacterized membrane protein (UPF0127 family)